MSPGPLPPASAPPHVRAGLRWRRPLAVACLAAVALSDCGDDPAPVPTAFPEGRPSVAAKPAGAVRVATLNVWAIPLVSAEVDERLARVGPALLAHDIDVVCLQEAFSGAARRLVAAGLGAGWTLTDGAPGGLVVCSRLPVEGSAFTPFPSFPRLSLPERLAAKGLLEVVVTTAAGPLRVVNAHLALAFGEGNPRTRQLEFLLDHLDARAAERSLPTVVAADLNTPSLRDGRPFPDDAAILGRGWTDADPPRDLGGGRFAPGPPTRVGWPRVAGDPHAYWPDRVLVRDGAAAAVRVLGYAVSLADPATAVSDHNLVLADLLVGPTPRPPDPRAPDPR